MKKKLLYTIGITLGLSFAAFAQNDKVKFGAIGRGMVQESKLKEDTINPNRNSTSNVVVDLRLNINPNRKTEIGTVIRMSSPLGGFYGGGAELKLRQLYMKGTLYNVVNYEVGDIYLELSPYTLFNNEAEGDINEASVFKNLREDYVYYDNFNIGNTWWSQGGHIDFSLTLDEAKKKALSFDVFTTRLKATSTMRFLAGGKIGLTNQDTYGLNFNAVQLFDAKEVNPSEESIKNSVLSLEGNYRLKLSNKFLLVEGEGGASSYIVNAPVNAGGGYIVPDDKTGYFFTLKTTLANATERFKVGARYLLNSADFLSAGAQTKRIDYQGSPEVFLNAANDPFNNRSLNLYDLVGAASIYNPVISSTLMAYNPKYGNALPYGLATPNRTGLMLDVSYEDSLNVFDAKVEAAILSDVDGVGTSEKRSFTHIKAEASLKFNQYLGFKKSMKVYGGTMYNKTTRDGGASKIDLTSLHIDAGLDIELFNRLFVGVGLKRVSAKGNEFLYDLSDNNIYTLPVNYSVDGSESIFAVGARYEFTDKMYLSFNNMSIQSTDDSASDAGYAFNQWMLFFSLKF